MWTEFNPKIGGRVDRNTEHGRNSTKTEVPNIEDTRLVGWRLLRSQEDLALQKAGVGYLCEDLGFLLGV